MAEILRSEVSDFDTTQALTGPQVPELITDEDIPRGAPCYITESGKLMLASGAAAGPEAKVRGFSSRNAHRGQPLTILLVGNRFGYSDGNLVPGSDIYLGATPGALSDTPTIGGTEPIAFAVDANDLVVL